MPRRRVKGYTDFGGIPLPVLPQYCIFTDRADGTLWHLGHSSNGLNIALNDATIGAVPKRIFAANDEPYLPSDPAMRIFVRGGRLGYEFRTLPQGEQDNDTMRLVSRRANENVQREMVKPSTFSLTNVGNRGVLAWQDNVA